MSGLEPLGIFVSGAFVVIFIFLIVSIFYCLSLYSALKLIPEEKHFFPAWLVWLILIPFVGTIFAWIMEPFGLPKTFEQAFADNKEAKAKTKTLFALGLAHVILMTLALISMIFGIASIVIWIIYWIKVVAFKNEYLLGQAQK